MQPAAADRSHPRPTAAVRRALPQAERVEQAASVTVAVATIAVALSISVAAIAAVTIVTVTVAVLALAIIAVVLLVLAVGGVRLGFLLVKRHVKLHGVAVTHDRQCHLVIHGGGAHVAEQRIVVVHCLAVERHDGVTSLHSGLGCRAVVLYPDPDAAPEAVTSEDLEPNVRIYYVPARKAGVSAFYRTWQPLLNEHVDAVHVMGDNALGVPGLYRFCRDHDIFFYSQLGAIKSTSENPVMRAVMDLLCRRNLAIYRKTPTYAKTPAVAAQLEQLHVPCAGVMPVGLDTAIIPNANGEKHELREFLKLDPKANYLVFVGRLDSYKRPLDLVPVLEALHPDQLHY